MPRRTPPDRRFEMPRDVGGATAVCAECGHLRRRHGFGECEQKVGKEKEQCACPGWKLLPHSHERKR